MNDLSIKELLINELEEVCEGNVYLQGTISENEAYPKSFITFWTNYTEDNSHFDDETVSVDWNFSVIFYSSDPSLVASEPPKIIEALKKQGFIPQGKGNDIASDVPTHTGWAMEFIKTEIL